MTRRMLIDATHDEETRVAVVDGHKLVDFDYESKVRKQLKGSIFLAKVTRVEPSLQAAFVNFGGNRHGFLPFSEIHPDYFRIPIADREALIAEQLAEMEARRAAEEAEDEQEAAAQAAASGEGGPAHEDSIPSSRVEESGDDEEDEIVEEVGGEAPPARNRNHATAHAVPVRHNDEDLEDQPEFEAEADTQDFSDNMTDEDDQESLPTSQSSESEEPGDGHEPGESNGNSTDVNSEGGREEGGRNGRRGGRNRYRGRGGGGREGGGRGGRFRGGRRMAAHSKRVEIVGGDGIEGDHPVRPTLRRHYKIQEVVKRGQIMLIQVSKEERGNKGAAVTTYLSLPGRYCVLMPNSPRAGGVSRKIANFAERKRMRELLAELQVPEGMSVIMRTAGVARTKSDIKRDLDYLMRLWDSVRDLTLQSTAPAAIHEEGNLIRRAIRDIYSKDIEELVVAGDEGHKLARDFMDMLIPSHVQKVREYKDEQIPLFHRYQVESQISAMGEPVVNLKSGGYIVINPTEALVSIDVNSGRATKERHIEETALKTNLEAAEEVARQLRLRDLGGLIVIDFIDMEDRRNNAKVERRLKEALSSDRARIQVGRISTFGLMELSRQRLNPSLTEAQFERCPHCQGIGYVRTIDSAVITALRAIEEEGIKGRAAEVVLSISNRLAVYILNNKRSMLADLERRYEFRIMIRIDETLPQSGFKIETLKAATGDAPRTTPLAGDQIVHAAVDDDVLSEDDEQTGSDDGDDDNDDGDDDNDDGEGTDGNNGHRPREQRPSSSEPRREHHGREGGGHRPEGSRDGEGGRGGRRRGRRGGRRRGRGGREGGPQGQPQQQAQQFHNDGQTGPRPNEQGQQRERNEDNRHRNHTPRGESRGPASTPAPLVATAPISNDRGMDRPASPPPARDYETVNAPPGEKKKGWWNKLIES